jgi:hypothetical protein
MSDGPSPGAWTDTSARTVLRQIFDAAVASADPGAAPCCGICRTSPAAAAWWSAPARRRLPWPRRWMRPGATSTSAGSSSPVTAAGCGLGRRRPQRGRRHPSRPGRAGRAHHGAGSLASDARRHERGGRPPYPCSRAGADGRRHGHRADVRRRFFPDGAGRGRDDPGRQAGRQPKPAGERRQHRRDERCAQTSLAHQGWPPCARRPSGSRCNPGDQRYPRR